MSFGLVVSIVLHATLLGFALISVGQTPPLEPKDPVQAIVADVISESELNRMRKGVREAKLDEAEAKDVKKPDEAQKDVPKPRPVAAQPPPPAAAEPPPPEPAKTVEVAKAEPPPPPPAPPEPKVEPPKPQPDKAALDQKLEELALLKAEEEKLKQEAEKKAAEEQRKLEEQKKAEELRKAEEKKKADEKRKADEKKKRELAEKKKREDEKRKADLAKQKQLDTSRLSALLDKTPDPKQAAAANDAPTKSAAKGPVRGDAQGRDSTISANEASFLAGLMRQQVSRCWNINAGLDGIQQMVVKFDVKLNEAGELVGEPRIVNTNPSPIFQDAAASAKRALIQCAPYQLPPDKFAGGWEHMILTFDPARMF